MRRTITAFAALSAGCLAAAVSPETELEKALP